MPQPERSPEMRLIAASGHDQRGLASRSPAAPAAMAASGAWAAGQLAA